MSSLEENFLKAVADMVADRTIFLKSFHRTY